MGDNDREGVDHSWLGDADEWDGDAYEWPEGDAADGRSDTRRVIDLRPGDRLFDYLSGEWFTVTSLPETLEDRIWVLGETPSGSGAKWWPVRQSQVEVETDRSQKQSFVGDESLLDDSGTSSPIAGPNTPAFVHTLVELVRAAFRALPF